MRPWIKYHNDEFGMLRPADAMIEVDISAGLFAAGVLRWWFRLSLDFAEPQALESTEGHGPESM